MQDLANALIAIIIGTFVLMSIEVSYAWYKGKFNFRIMDTIFSLSAGMTNAIKNVLGLTAVIKGYKYMFENFRLVDQDTHLAYLSYGIDRSIFCHLLVSSTGPQCEYFLESPCDTSLG